MLSAYRRASWSASVAGDVRERDHDALDPVVVRAVGQHLRGRYHRPSWPWTSAAWASRLLEHRAASAEVGVGELWAMSRSAGRRPPGSGRQALVGRREPPDAEAAVEEQRRDVGAGQQVVEIVVALPRSSSTLAWSWVLTVVSSSLSDCSSSLEVSSSSLVVCSSSLTDMTSSLDAFSSSLVVCSSSMVLCSSSRVVSSSASSWRDAAPPASARRRSRHRRPARRARRS